MIDFTKIAIEQVQDVLIQARKSSGRKLLEIGQEMGGVSDSTIKNKETHISGVRSEDLFKYIKAIGGALHFEPDASKDVFGYIGRVMKKYKSGKIDAATAGRKIVQKLSKP